MRGPSTQAILLVGVPAGIRIRQKCHFRRIKVARGKSRWLTINGYPKTRALVLFAFFWSEAMLRADASLNSKPLAFNIKTLRGCCFFALMANVF